MVQSNIDRELIKMPERRTSALTIRIRPTVKVAIDRLAAEDRRSVASFVGLVVEDYVLARKPCGN